jgi:hypothetical protein
MRRLAAFVAQTRPHILAVCDIPPGDSLSLATRFDLQWAYRGKQALFWNAAFAPGGVEGEYLPLRAPRLFGRRGFVRVDGMLGDLSLTIAVTQFGRDRRLRIPELRFARTQLRSAHRAAVFFAQFRQRRIGFADLGFHDIAPSAQEQRIFVRGLEAYEPRAAIATV